MAGHSKWNNIKNKKGAEDKKRGKVFSLIAKQIKSAVKEGGSGDPNSNPALRTALDKAKAANMPKDNIQRAIDRGLGKSSSGAQLMEILYEGFGPGGIGFLVESVTDNKNRTGSEVKFLFSKYGGSLAGPGSVSYMFERKGEDYVATMAMPVDDSNVQNQLQNLMDDLLANDDVEDVYVAGEWPDKN